MEWIPVNKKLPDIDHSFWVRHQTASKYLSETSDYVLISIIDRNGNSDVAIGRCEEHKNRRRWITSSRKAYEVVAWMPMIEPYNEKEAKRVRKGKCNVR